MARLAFSGSGGRGEVVKMEQFAWFLIGMAAGVAWYRSYIRDLIRKNPCTRCDYCEFEIMKERIFKKK